MSNAESEKTQAGLPAWAVILDVIGTVLLAAGLYGLFAQSEAPFAETVDLRANATALIVIGVFLMLPLLVAVVRRVASQAQR